MTNHGGASRRAWLVVAAVLLGALCIAASRAPDFLSTPIPDRAYLMPWQAPPFGTDDRGIGLQEVALQGAAIVTGPSIASAVLVMVLATLAGLVRCLNRPALDGLMHGAMELVGSLPRLVVVLVVAMLVPREWKGLLPIGLCWAVLAAPGAMDEAASTAGRLGGERFVEALRAHGFSATRIYLYHVVGLNLRPVLVRQGAEVMMQVVFLEIALSYLALRRSEPSFTHPDSAFSWATLLYQGYTALLGVPLWHAGALGLFLVGATAILAQAMRLAARAR